MVQSAYDTRSFISIEPDSKRQVCNNAKLTPAVIDSGLSSEVVTLEKTSLDAGKSY